MFAVPSFFGYNTTFVNGPVATAATGVGETSFTANWDAFTGATYYLLDVSTSPSFSSFVLQDEFTTSTSYVVIGLTASTTYYYRVRANVGVDPDAQAFFDRVTTAGGTLSATEQTATNQLVLDMKAAGIWTKMKAVYPMVGASAAACAQNLKSSSFTGTFTSGWTFASTGVTPNGTSAYFDTTFNPNTSISDINSSHLSIYSRTTTGNNAVDIGVATPAWDIEIIYSAFYAGMMDGNYLSTANADAKGLWTNSRISSSSVVAYRNGSTFVSGTNSPTTKPNYNVYIGARNDANIPLYFSNREFAFASIGDGLTSTNVSNFYTAVQTFNQTLNRQVGPQIVSDADAQAYIDRVYTAGGTLTNTEANAVNQLTIDMKAYGIWSAMKAVYPMVGASAAACAQNLKSSSFTGTFTSGWTFASSGASNVKGQASYMDTGLLPSSELTTTNTHLSYYNNLAVSSDQNVVMGNGNINTSWIGLYLDSNLYYTAIGCGFTSTTLGSSTAFFLSNKPNSTTLKFIKNATILDTKTVTTNSFGGSQNIFLNNYDGSFAFSSGSRCAFASIGDGLTDTQASNFYTAVQAFQTTLNRQVV